LTTVVGKLGLVGNDDFGKMNQVYVRGIYNLFEVAKTLDIKRVIYSSTIHVTGLYEKDGFSVLGRKIKESDYPMPDGVYGSMKLFGESIARLYAKEHDIKVTCMRFGGVAEANEYNKYYLRGKRIMLYHEDLVMVMKAVFETESDFGVFYAVSENKHKPWCTRKLRRVFKVKQSDFVVKQNSSLYHKVYMKIWRVFHLK
jgi:nucleoside-diphosphate-sugar epimerase